ncbi:hypothetical protein PSHT_06620 [Puccinia striiformis]|uniref:Uncharacterized protein n=2 Tax=Puccinia striiformis TaxID=27350 RepID=A0A2S4W469_9BASI|nr:hypothetical protein PSHT_06620 [Puccinia striiformis]
MLTAIYVACVLAACAIASPVQSRELKFQTYSHEARGFSSYSHDSAQSAENHASQASMDPISGQMSSSDSVSSAVSHNSGSNMIGGGLGGFGLGSGGLGFGNAGGMSASSSMSSLNSMSALNSLSAGGIGDDVGMIGGAGFGMNQQSSFSASSAISSFQNVNSMISGMQSMLVAGSMSRTVAQQSMQRLSQSLQIAMTQATGCISCFVGQGSQFASVASSTFNQVTSFMSQMQGAFGGNSGPIFTRQTFRSFFGQATRSTISSSTFSNMISPNFVPVMQNIIPGIGGSLLQLNF